MTDIFRTLAPAWAALELAFPVLAAAVALHLLVLIGAVAARPAGLGPKSPPWTYLRRVADAIEAVTIPLGRLVAWLALIMVVVQFVIVVMSYVFSVGFIWLQESMIYMHAALFMLAAAYTLKEDGHVRVDVFFRTAGIRQKSITDFVGHLFLLVPVMALIVWVSYSYVTRSWAFFEGSKETSGIQGVFLLKSLILIFALSMFLQGFALAVQAGHRLVGGIEPEGPHPPPGQAL